MVNDIKKIDDTSSAGTDKPTEEDVKKFVADIKKGSKELGFRDVQLTKEEWEKAFPLDTDSNIEDYIMNCMQIGQAMKTLSLDLHELLSEDQYNDMARVIKKIKDDPKVSSGLVMFIASAMLASYDKGFRMALHIVQGMLSKDIAETISQVPISAKKDGMVELLAKKFRGLSN